MTTKTKAAIRSLAAFRAHFTMAQNKAKKSRGPAKKEAAQRALEIGTRMRAFEKKHAKTLAA